MGAAAPARDATGFRFVADFQGRVNGASFYWRLPSGIARKDELLRAFHRALWFPDVFTFEWDALFDGLCDFSWMSDRTIILVHEALPRLPDSDLRHYLSILRDAVRWWREDEPHKLEVVFPEWERRRIERLLETSDLH
jgi:hypothetical protein